MASHPRRERRTRAARRLSLSGNGCYVTDGLSSSRPQCGVSESKGMELLGQSGKTVAYAALAVVVLGNVLGQVLMKIGAQLPAEQLVFFRLFGWPTFWGISVFGACVLLYAWALRAVDLHVAQVIVVLQFVGAVLAASLFFGEHINLQKWFGMMMIVGGFVVCMLAA